MAKERVVVAEDYRLKGPLDHLALARNPAQTMNPGGTRVSLTQTTGRCFITLRGDASDAGFDDATRRTLATPLPATANTVTVNAADDTRVLWLGPDEWLVDARSKRLDDILAGFRADLAGTHALVSDVTHAKTCLQLAGEGSRDVLAKGCSLDLHPRTFTLDNCAQSLLGRCHMLLHMCDTQPRYNIYVGRSFADYAWKWLCDAGLEFGINT